MTEHVHPDGDLSFEEFNELVDEAKDSSCSFCFSFGHYKHLNQSARMAAYLSFEDKEEERVAYLASELERLKDEPLDDNIYFLVISAELLDTNNVAHHQSITKNVLARAREMVARKMPSAWAAVRAYAWIRGSNQAVLPEFLDATDDLDVWQTVMQQASKHMLSLPDLIFCRDKVYQYTLKALKLEDPIKSYVISVNGCQALMRLLDERALEVWHKLPRRSLERCVAETATNMIKHLQDIRQTQYVPVLMEIKDLSEKSKKA